MAVKAYFLIRDDLEMSPAKLGIQVGHGVDMIWLCKDTNSFHSKWVDEFSRRKIVLKASLGKIDNILSILSDEVKVSAIIDNGLTEFNGNKTLTGVVIHPIEEELLPKAIKRLRLWS